MGNAMSGNSATAVTLTLNFNLFNGGQTRRAIAEAKNPTRNCRTGYH